MSSACQGHTSLPIAVGFGVKTAEQARAIAKERRWRGGGLRPRQRGQGQSDNSAGKPTPETVKAVHALVSEIAQGVRS